MPATGEPAGASMTIDHISTAGMKCTLGYFIAHESHHRGNILLTLKECGHNLGKDVQYATWGWDQI